MTDKTRFIDARRRGFLKGGAAVTGAAISGQALADAPETPAEPAPAREAPTSRGYRLTEHVRTYYQRARF